MFDLIQEVNDFIWEFRQLDMEESATDDEDKENGKGWSQEDVDVVSEVSESSLDIAYDSEED